MFLKNNPIYSTVCFNSLPWRLIFPLLFTAVEKLTLRSALSLARFSFSRPLTFHSLGHRRPSKSLVSLFSYLILLVERVLLSVELKFRMLFPLNFMGATGFGVFLCKFLQKGIDMLMISFFFFFSFQGLWKRQQTECISCFSIVFL